MYQNDIHVYKYPFEDGKAYLFDLIFTAPATSMENITTFEKAFNKMNDVTGYIGQVTRNEDGCHTTQHVCIFNEMSDKNI